MKIKYWYSIATIIQCSLLIIPLSLGLTKISNVADHNIFDAVLTFDQHPFTQDALLFSLGIGISSACLTLLVGLPVAWILARYKWPKIKLIRAILTMPFVMPSIVVAVGFLSLIDPVNGPLAYIGIDLRRETGIVGKLAEIEIFEHPGHLIALLIAHIWFNLALVIRLTEPSLRDLDEDRIDQLRVLPGGKSRLDRWRNLWWPLLRPAIGASFLLTFVQCFSSFVLVRQLMPGSFTIERSLGELGGAAGIPGYGSSDSSMVLGGSILQVSVMIFAMLALSWTQSRQRTVEPMTRRENNEHESPNALITLILVIFIVFSVLPLILVILGSFQIQNSWSLVGWGSMTERFQGGTSIFDGIRSSIFYALITVLFGLPLSWGAASTIDRLERSGKEKTAVLIDTITLLPLGVSAAIVGLGLLVGIQKTIPTLFASWWIPIWGHLVIATPFSIRVILSGMRRLDPAYMETGATLGLKKFDRILRIQLPLLRGSIIVSTALIMAISLGEFGASWVLLRGTETMTLPLVIDAQMSRPSFDPTIRPSALAGSAILMFVTLILFLTVERWRDEGDNGGF
mgnify:CR=1 FL=1